jgi:hypothetical protein
MFTTQYDNAGNRQHADAGDAFQRCLTINPNLPRVAARLQVLRNHHDPLVDAPDKYKIHRMCNIQLCAIEDLHAY